MAIMESWGVNEKGFYRPTLEDIITEKNKKARELFGNDLDTDEKTWIGKMFRINAAAENKLCEIAENVYYSIFPSTARGISLDRVCEFVNLTREGESHAYHELKVYGEHGYTINMGTLFKNADGIEFYCIEDFVIDKEEIVGKTTSYYADIIVKCIQSGEDGNVRNIDATVEVNENIDKVEYTRIVAYGTAIESDPALRAKFSEVVNGLGTNTTSSIMANILRVAGVNNVIIIDNNTEEDMEISDDLTVSSGSYGIIVHSDSTENELQIAEAIREKMPFGIRQSGTVAVDVKDDASVTHTVRFSYVENQSINVYVAIEKDATFPTDGKEQIEQNITSYINSLGIGEEVIFSRLYDYIYNVTGVYKVANITLNGAKEDISVPKVKIAKVGTIEVEGA